MSCAGSIWKKECGWCIHCIKTGDIHISGKTSWCKFRNLSLCFQSVSVVKGASWPKGLSTFLHWEDFGCCGFRSNSDSLSLCAGYVQCICIVTNDKYFLSICSWRYVHYSLTIFNTMQNILQIKPLSSCINYIHYHLCPYNHIYICTIVNIYIYTLYSI